MTYHKVRKKEDTCAAMVETHAVNHIHLHSYE